MSTNGIRLVVAVAICAAALLYLLWAKDRRRDQPLEQKITCAKNLAQIGLAFRQWALDHDGQYPFNVSTNAGGTRELCAPDSSSFDRRAAVHLQVMTNTEALTSTRLLICPEDTSRQAATQHGSVRPDNVTYRMHTGTNVTGANPKEVLLVCPIDGNILYCDGTVLENKKP